MQYYSGLLEAHTDIIVMRGRRNNIVLNFYKLYEAARTPLQTVLNIFDIYDDRNSTVATVHLQDVDNMRVPSLRKLNLVSRIHDRLQLQQWQANRLKRRSAVHERVQNTAEAPDVTFCADLQ